MTTESIIKRLNSLGLKQRDLSAAIGMDQSKLSRALSGERRWQVQELQRASDWLDEMDSADAPYKVEADHPAEDLTRSYAEVGILPTYAGMGGGGTGDDHEENGLVPRYLIEDVLRGRAENFRLVRVRGDSMEPDYYQDDEILIDIRDRFPVQPGPFAIWDGDGHVLKNVERVEGGLRLFPTNKKYSEKIVTSDHESVYIMGRVVWFARRV
jgi:phage repressor protein C with HTH and peptisase S24 domain